MAAGDIVVISENSSGRKGNYFDGVDDYVLHDAHAVARVAAGDTVGTYTAWIYLENISGSYTILSAGDDNSANELMRFDSNAGKLMIFVKDTATQFNVHETVGSLTARTWTHVAIRQNGTRPDLFVNGVKCTMTDTTATDLTRWYGDLGGVDKFAIGCLESNATHTQDFYGAIGQVKYWSMALSDEEIMNEAKELTQPNATVLDAALQFNITMTDDGTNDTAAGHAGTHTGHAYYGGLISDWSYRLNGLADVTGHAAEFINTFIDGSKYVSVIKKGD